MAPKSSLGRDSRAALTKRQGQCWPPSSPGALTSRRQGRCHNIVLRLLVCQELTLSVLHLQGVSGGGVCRALTICPLIQKHLSSFLFLKIPFI